MTQLTFLTQKDFQTLETLKLREQLREQYWKKTEPPANRLCQLI